MTAKTVMVVDDSRVSRMMICAIITDAHPDWRVIEAGSGDEAVTGAREHAPDLITLDVNMPGKTGLDVAPELRSSCPRTRIVLLTANVSEEVRSTASSLGLELVLKPITEDKVIALVQ